MHWLKPNKFTFESYRLNFHKREYYGKYTRTANGEGGLRRTFGVPPMLLLSCPVGSAKSTTKHTERIDKSGSEPYFSDIRTPCSAHRTPCSALRAPCPAHRTPCSALRTPCPVLRTPCPVLRTPCPAHRTPCPVLRTPCSVFRTPRSALRTPRSALRTPRSVLRAPRTEWAREIID